jgi:hypothetical protein
MDTPAPTHVPVKTHPHSHSPEPTPIPAKTPAPSGTPEPTPKPTCVPDKTHEPAKTPKPTYAPKHERADLCPADISVNGKLKAGSEITLESAISNKGLKDSGSFKVKWMINDKVAANAYHTSVPAKATIKDSSCSISWTPKKPGKYDITFIVDSENEVLELNNQNNMATTTVYVKH